MNQRLFPIVLSDSIIPDHMERITVEKVAQEAVKVGLSTHRRDLVNLYVSLKSKPLLILSGPPRKGKVALLKYLTASLTGGNVLQGQIMTGHPWWANKTPNVAFFVNAQYRYNTERLLDMVEEAWQPQNVQKVYIACLTGISPSELLDFFRDVAFQLQHGEIMRLGDAHFSEPIPYPPNLSILGTMNTDHFYFWEADLLRKATIIHWSPETDQVTLYPWHRKNTAAKRAFFLGSSIRNKVDACRKLRSILGEYRTTDLKEPLLPLFRIENLLTQCEVLLPTDWLEGVLIYLANSWTQEGEGLFHRSHSLNLRLAMDFAIAQSVIPYVKDGIQAIVDLRIGLKRILKGQFSYSTAFVDWLAQPADNY